MIFQFFQINFENRDFLIKKLTKFFSFFVNDKSTINRINNQIKQKILKKRINEFFEIHVIIDTIKSLNSRIIF